VSFYSIIATGSESRAVQKQRVWGVTGKAETPSAPRAFWRVAPGPQGHAKKDAKHILWKINAAALLYDATVR
jgi:hypothetical protein